MPARDHLQRIGAVAPALRRRAGALVVDNFFRGISSLGAMHPLARPERHNVRVVRDVAYLPADQAGSRDHLLDIWLPERAAAPPPVVLYIHGGGFRILSKDTHWVMGLSFARRGYAVFNVNYRLAPGAPFPAAVQDVAAAYRWVVDNAASWGADPSRLILAGESAGANLAATLAVMTSYRRPEPWAQEVFALGRRPQAVVAACGMMQVSDPARFRRRKPNLGTMIFDRISEVSHAYIGGRAEGCDLADPLCIVERETPEHALPPFFLPVGTRDPILDDTRRFGAALERHGVPADVRYYRGGLHAFHAAVFTEAARQCWQDTFAFLERHVPVATRADPTAAVDFTS